MFTLICPKHAIPFYIPQPLQLKKKNTPCCYTSSPSPHNFPSFLYFLPPSHHQLISDMQSPFYLFFYVSLAVAQCTLLKCIFSNHSSKANCLPGEPQPCPMLQEITVRLSRTRWYDSVLRSAFSILVWQHCATQRQIQ